MTEEDRNRWDERHAGWGPAAAGPPRVFAPHVDLFPTSGASLDIACGRGQTAVWLAQRGMTCRGLDISPVAVGLARELADRGGVADRCRFEVVDLDDGLPEGPPVDLVLSSFFRDPRLDRPILDRLGPGGLLAIAVCSEVGAGPGPYRVRPGELRAAFADLELLAEGEQDGEAWLLARAPRPP